MGKKKQRTALSRNFVFGAVVIIGLSAAAIALPRLLAQGSEGGSTSSQPDLVIQNLQFVSQSSDLATVEYDVVGKYPFLKTHC